VDAVQQTRLLGQQQLSELAALQARFAEPRTLARHLISQGWLTPYQTNLLFQGRGRELVLGQYLLLERLGEGGMGQVFKARHLNMERLVALKVIRKEHLDNADAIRRFQREVKAAARLSHATVVMAYDADEVDGTHYYVMEYVAGTDLATLLKRAAPPPLHVACDYIRQAALGLQHAHEQGMVHRDIKPANLLVAGAHPTASPWPFGEGIVKILDMGVARFQHPDGRDSLSQLTKEGRVVGTPDYMSPEQAVNPHTADIRADIYSLGCTFYHLLTGQAPFPGGTVMEKLLHHRLDQPTPVEKLRPEVPRELSGIVRKMMAKKPGERYSQPGELARALLPWCSPDALSRRSTPPTAAEIDTADSPLTVDSNLPRGIGFDWPRWRLPLLAAVLVAFLMMASCGMGWWLFR
jgi:serine/threonine protein kinase